MYDDTKVEATSNQEEKICLILSALFICRDGNYFRDQKKSPLETTFGMKRRPFGDHFKALFQVLLVIIT